MKIIGLTGGIASGKSLVSGFFEAMDIIVLDADKIYKNLLKTNKLLYNEIKKEFGFNEINFKLLADIVFNDEVKMKKLNKITHPYVIRSFREQINRLIKTEKLIVLDIPLLYEAKMEDFCDEIICVYVDSETQIKRLKERDKISLDEALKKINSQMPLEEKVKYSDYIIDNSYTEESTFEQFKQIFQKIKESIDVN